MKSFNFKEFIFNYFVEDYFDYEKIEESSAVLFDGTYRYKVRVDENLTKLFQKELNNQSIVVMESISGIDESYEVFCMVDGNAYNIAYQMNPSEGTFEQDFFPFSEEEDAFMEEKFIGISEEAKISLQKIAAPIKDYLMNKSKWRLYFVTGAIKEK